MPYTLLKFLLWAVLFALVGGVVGWMLRSLRVRREVADAKAQVVDQDEVERLRHRVESLEGVVAERDRLRIQVAELRGVESPGIVGAGVPDDESVPGSAPSRAATSDEMSEPEDGSVVAATSAPGGSDQGEEADGSGADDGVTDRATDGIGDRVDDGPADGAGGDAARSVPLDDERLPSDDDGTAPGAGEATSDDVTPEADRDEHADDDAASTGVPTEVPSVEGAEEVLGRSIEPDDLTAVEGIGPNIAELCRGIGITGWQDLAATPVDELRSMLADAGSRYQVHDPTSWPRQAELLAAGRWAEFQALIDELDRGR